jgi:proteasome accessory factor C
VTPAQRRDGPAAASYVQRVETVLAVLEDLRRDGPRTLADLATRHGAPPKALREDLGQLLETGLLDFTAGDEYAVTEVDPLRALGLYQMGVADAAALVLLGRAWAEVAPTPPALRSAIYTLERVALQGPDEPTAVTPSAGGTSAIGRTLRAAVVQHRAARIRYARAWRPGVYDREIHPYALVLTRRGWECDAGPLVDGGELRTYLLSNIQDAELLGSVPAPGMIERDELVRMRRTRTVTLVLPQGTRWVADQFAERVHVVRQDDDLELACELLPPVPERVGLILATAGPDAFVAGADAAELGDAGREYAQRLLDRYEQG